MNLIRAMRYVALCSTVAEATPEDDDFAARCAAPGVVRCYGFEDPAHVQARVFAAGSGMVRGQIVTDVVASGQRALRFTVPGNTPADTSGSFWLNFADDLSQQFGPGQEFWIQFRQRFTPGMLRSFQGGQGWKQIIVGEGDQPGQPTAYSCTELEIVFQQNAAINGPWMYHSCGRWSSLEYFDGTQVRMQHQGPPYCYYPNDPARGCERYQANVWMVFQLHVQIGTWNTDSSRIEAFMGLPGQPLKRIFDSALSHPSGFRLHNNPGSGSGTNPGARYGKMWLLPYNTNKSASEAHPTEYVWYDEVIVSRQPIPAPGVAAPDGGTPMADAGTPMDGGLTGTGGGAAAGGPAGGGSAGGGFAGGRAGGGRADGGSGGGRGGGSAQAGGASGGTPQGGGSSGGTSQGGGAAQAGGSSGGASQGGGTSGGSVAGGSAAALGGGSASARAGGSPQLTAETMEGGCSATAFPPFLACVLLALLQRRARRVVPSHGWRS
jgi:hypothetical protein